MDRNAPRNHRRTRVAAKQNLEYFRDPRSLHNGTAFLPICKLLCPFSVGVHPRKLLAVRVSDDHFVMVMLPPTILEPRHGCSVPRLTGLTVSKRACDQQAAQEEVSGLPLLCGLLPRLRRHPGEKRARGLGADDSVDVEVTDTFS